MKLTSTHFKENENIPSQYTCEGLGCNPELHIQDVPKGTLSLALIMDDPDVPVNIRKDCMYDHWVVFNMPKDTAVIKENLTPPGTLGKNTSGSLGYIGPCPPDRRHRYFFKLYALDCTLPLAEGATKKQVEKAMDGHILAQATLMGTYEKHHVGDV
ncbi:MAG: YbhB/YbcL family Raf kinase inhibitor-like protein [Chlamydiales bacterium]|nr:YbhB/YbcL family Raf kinase inhibitor-like protein [Chlamydiales bacterium]